MRWSGGGRLPGSGRLTRFMAGPLPKARYVLKADAVFRAVLGLLLVVGAPAVLTGSVLFAQTAGVLLLGWALVLRGVVDAGSSAVRLVTGANAVASLAGMIVIFGWLSSSGEDVGFIATLPGAGVALALLVFGVFSALYWGRLRATK